MSLSLQGEIITSTFVLQMEGFFLLSCAQITSHQKHQRWDARPKARRLRQVSPWTANVTHWAGISLMAPQSLQPVQNLRSLNTQEAHLWTGSWANGDAELRHPMSSAQGSGVTCTARCRPPQRPRWRTGSDPSWWASERKGNLWSELAWLENCLTHTPYRTSEQIKENKTSNLNFY